MKLCYVVQKNNFDSNLFSSCESSQLAEHFMGNLCHSKVQFNSILFKPYFRK